MYPFIKTVGFSYSDCWKSSVSNNSFNGSIAYVMTKSYLSINDLEISKGVVRSYELQIINSKTESFILLTIFRGFLRRVFTKDLI